MNKTNFLTACTKETLTKNIRGYFDAHHLKTQDISISDGQNTITIAISFKKDYIIGPDIFEDLLIRVTNCQWPDSNPTCPYLDPLSNEMGLDHDLTINFVQEPDQYNNSPTYVIKIQI